MSWRGRVRAASINSSIVKAANDTYEVRGALLSGSTALSPRESLPLRVCFVVMSRVILLRPAAYAGVRAADGQDQDQGRVHVEQWNNDFGPRGQHASGESRPSPGHTYSRMTTFDGWVPSQYNKFAAEREQPFWDLASLVQDVSSPAVADLGCGDGRLTVALGNALGAATIFGVDNSHAMIADATAYATARVRFQVGDIGMWTPANSFDVVFANASMQWVPDHRAVLARWASALRPGGQLAIQIPANADHPSHLVAAELAREFFDDPPADVVAQNVLTPETYVELLDALGFADQHVQLQVYAHRLSSTAEVVEWMKETSLTRFKEPLSESGWEQFVATYRERLLARLGERSPYLYPFKRILLWARQGDDGS